MTAFLLQHLLERAAARWPARLAVSADGRTLTYQELSQQSDAVATFLRARGVRAGDRVGLHVRKSVGAIVAIYGVLKAGAAYVPLDPMAPAARLGFILRDCGVRCVITHAAGEGQEQREAILPDDEPLDTLLVLEAGAEVAPSGLPARSVFGWPAATASPRAPAEARAEAIDTDLAYVLYTSGSTGQPKGVMISHRNALTFVNWSLARFNVREDDRLSNHAPFHFDLSIFDIFVAAAAGASLHPVPEGLSTFPMRLSEWLEREGISIWYSVPSILMLLVLHGGLERRLLQRLRLVLFAGEVFPLKHLQSLVAALPAPRYFNLYGPTETNVCTYYEVEKDSIAARASSIPIGRACENMDTFVVSTAGNLVTAPGETGELLVRGSGVALGYWGRADRTAQGFVQNPLDARFRDIVYRTGDIVSIDEKGDYLYLGRADHQIKSRGYRIELGEIENALHGHPLVREAAAIAVPDELVGNRIRAVVSLVDGANLTSSELQAHCASRLPRYMVPEAIAIRTQLPRTLNGKVDRVSLVAAEA